MAPSGVKTRRKHAAVLSISGASGAGKTRLLTRLIPVLVSRGLRIAAIKHSGHHHALDRRGKDSQRLHSAGAEAVAIQTASAMALFGPPVERVEDLVALLPPVDLVLVEGWKSSRLPKVEVHRRRVSREFFCADDRRFIAVVTDEPPPRSLPSFGPNELEAIADFVEGWARGGAAARRGSANAKVARTAGPVSGRRRSPRGARPPRAPSWP